MTNERLAPARPASLCSVVIPVYNERENVGAMHDALRETALAAPEFDWEFIFVDDGSTDDTFEQLGVRHRADPRLKVLRLSRNYGSHTGAAAGLRYASGDAAVIMAGDLQDHPREIPRFLMRWREGYHVVWGVRSEREDRGIDAFLARLFAGLVRRIALPNYPINGTGSFCLIDRKVIDALNSFPERNRMTFGLILHAGFRHGQIVYQRQHRHSGSSKWTFRRKIKTTIDTIVSFSTVPIRFVSLMGIGIATAGMIYAAYLVAYRLLHDTPAPEGWTTIMVLLLVLGGLQLTVLGMLGEYIWRGLDDIRRRPLFFLQETVGRFQILEGGGRMSQTRDESAFFPAPLDGRDAGKRGTG